MQKNFITSNFIHLVASLVTKKTFVALIIFFIFLAAVPSTMDATSGLNHLKKTTSKKSKPSKVAEKNISKKVKSEPNGTYNFETGRWKELHDTGWGSTVTQMVIYNDTLIVGLGNSAIQAYNFTTESWTELHDKTWEQAVTQMVIYSDTLIVGLANSAVQAYNFTTESWTELHNKTWETAVTQMVIYKDKLIVGLRNSAIQAYDFKTKSWTELHNRGWEQAVTQMVIYNNTLIVGLANSAVQAYNFTTESWTELQNKGWNNTITQMVLYNDTLIVGLGNSAVEAYNFKTKLWTELHDSGWNNSITKMVIYNDNLILGLANSAVQAYDFTAKLWTELHDAEWKRAVTQMVTCNETLLVGLENSAVEAYNFTTKSWSELHNKEWYSSINQMVIYNNNTLIVGLGSSAVEAFFPADWMQQNLDILGTLTLRNLCMPGSHDSGNSINDHANKDTPPDCTVVTQTRNILGQLNYGARYFDIRPILGSGTYRTGHYTEVDYTIDLCLGGWGETIDNVVNEINDFTKSNNELIILSISHDFDTDNSCDPFSEQEWDKLFKKLLKINNLYVTDTTDLTNFSLSDFIGNNQPAVIIVVNEDDVDLGSYASKGFYTSQQFPLYDVYSDTNVLEEMMDNQFAKMKKQRTSRDSKCFLLSWTLTQSVNEVKCCSGYIPLVCDFKASYPSILDLASQANQNIGDIYNECSKQCYPNIIYVDNVGETDVLELAIKINKDFAIE